MGNEHPQDCKQPGGIMVNKYLVDYEMGVWGDDSCPIKRSRFEEAVKVVWNGLMSWPICSLGPW